MSFYLVHFLSSCKISRQTAKSLEMGAKIKSVRKINEIFLLFSLILKNHTFFPHTSILTKKVFFGYFKSQISKCPPPKKELGENYFIMLRD